MLDKIKEFVGTLPISQVLKDYLVKPIDEGKHYHLGGISEILKVTEGLPTGYIDYRISEGTIRFPDESFTVEYYTDVVNKKTKGIEVTSTAAVLCRNISPNLALVTSFGYQDNQILYHPFFVIVPLKKLKFPKGEAPMKLIDYMSEEGVEEELIESLSVATNVVAVGTSCYFYMGFGYELEDELLMEALSTMRDFAVHIAVRCMFFSELITAVKVTPDMPRKTKGDIQFPVTDRTYYAFPQSGSYLGFTKKGSKPKTKKKK